MLPDPPPAGGPRAGIAVAALSPWQPAGGAFSWLPMPGRPAPC